MKLHIGGEEAHPDWKILNIQDADYVDFVGDCRDLSQFEDESIEAIYASHILEHLGYQEELPMALAECHRVLTSGGQLMISVPNFGVLCQMFISELIDDQQRWTLMRLMFGGQVDSFDFHKIGFIEPFLVQYLDQTGFSATERVEEFNLFDDTSKMRLGPHLISLNMVATK